MTLEMVLLKMSEAPKAAEAKKSSFPPKASSQKPAPKNSFSPQSPLPPQEQTPAPPRFTEKSWQDWLQFVRKKEAQMAIHLKSFSILAKGEDQILFGYPKDNAFLEEKSKNPVFRKKLKQYLFEFFGKDISYEFQINAQESLRKKQMNKEVQNHIHQIEKAKEHPLAEKITDLFQAQVQNTPSPKDL